MDERGEERKLNDVYSIPYILCIHVIVKMATDHEMYNEIIYSTLD